MDQILTIGLNGLTVASLYFLVASGLTLIFGMMRIVNLAHGAFYLLGGYVAFSVLQGTESWSLGLLAALAAVGAVGVVMHQVLLRAIEHEDMRVALVTIGVSLILADQLLVYYGGVAHSVVPPDFLSGGMELGVAGIVYPRYRIFVLGLAILVGIALWLFISRTRFGMIIRAGVDDRDMVSATGINVRVVFAAVFFIGSALAGLAGAVGAGAFSLAPGTDVEYLLYSLIVVIVGGMGSIPGAAIGALLVGLVSQFALGYTPAVASIVTFALMIGVLAVRPQGLLGRTA
ncbi:branched-chain amino acid ABC transporter permease [Actinobacteria bacterium YIM 96077]|uniref:Branched-chain amino acid ABC transporter permease n=1 Tax=Phytoactinopolyspora halophila TaxID=1981511 RepID=A0A329QW98_9ACTN|nr:branched-chain amino acid ABC transporter permease [Phytoactinopolyspora halophila]AYY13875.1 branched-chain amino acid ABC transporter permease [Actinobacteria bacterium YIM 96077]RAW15582.1 branched-chain amino acid ABC transporter permease [Phytoactinopolyspora halophila]